MKNQKIKTSTIFFLIGILLLGALIFMFAVPQQQFIGIKTEDSSIGASGDFSEPTTIILFSIMVLAILIGFIFKLWFENKRKV